MKKIMIFLSLILIPSLIVRAQSWSQDVNFPGTARDYDAGFSIGHYGFIGNGLTWSGPTFYNDFYKWNQTTGVWSAITAYPGAGQASGIACTVNGKGYVGLGRGIGGVQSDLWMYDTGTNSWTQKATFPGSARYDVSFFVIGHNIYLIGGSQGGPPYLGDVWVYNAVTDSWKQLNASPAPGIDAMVAFAIGNHGYLGGGWDGASYYNAFWEYDTTNDTWTSIAAFPLSGVSGDPRAFVIGSKGYVATGDNGGTYINPQTFHQGYAYDTVTKTWSIFSAISLGIGRAFATAFTIGNCGYIGTGTDSNGNYLSSFWQYCNSDEGVNEITNLEPNIIVYPNPSDGKLTISYHGLNDNSSLFTISDEMGRIIKTFEVRSVEGRIFDDESGLANGIYFYQMNDGNQRLNGKFIINK